MATMSQQEAQSKSDEQGQMNSTAKDGKWHKMKSTCVRRNVLKALGAGASATILAGCTGGSGGDGSTPTTTGESTTTDSDGTAMGTTTDGSLTQVNVIVGVYGVWDNSLQYMLGTERGFYEEEGLDVRKIDAPSGGGDLVRAVASSADVHMGIPVGTLGLYAAFAEGVDVRILANHQNMSRDIIWYTTTDSEYTSLEDADGAKIAFSDPGSSTHLMASQALEHANLENAEAISTGGPADANSALQSGQVDFAWTAPPFFLNDFEEYGGDKYRIGWRGGDVPPFPNLSVRVDFSTQGWLSENQETVRALYRAHKRVADWAYSNLDDAVDIWGNVLDIDDNEFLRNIVETTYPRECIRLDAIKGIDEVNQFAVEYDFLDSELSQDQINTLFDTSYLPTTDGDTYA